MRAARAFFLAPLAISIAACGRMVAVAPIPAGPVPLVGDPGDELARIAPVPAEGVAFPGEAIIRFRDGETPVDPPGTERIGPVAGVPGAYLYRIAGGTYSTAAVTSFEADPRIEYAEPNYIYRTQDFYPPGESFTNLYGHKKIHAPKAWDKARGKSNVIVAVVDTGVDYTHADLKDAVIKGPDVINRDNDSMDDHGHGTHVAGTIGAIANGSGIAGVAFGVKILGVKVLSAAGYGSQAGIADGIDAAVKNGARVINMSLGGPDSRSLRDAVTNATRKGVLCVAASGNDGDTNPDFPGAHSDALGVGATDSADKRSYFSNYGTTVDIAAPGSNIYSLGLKGTYKTMSGTSMATPHVAGAAGLLLSAKPDLTLAQLRKVLLETGDAVDGFSKTPDLRRLNLAKAVDALGKLQDAPAPDPTSSPELSPPGGGEPEPTPTPPPAPPPAPPADPQISDLEVPATSKDGATLRWKTDLPSKCTVQYGQTTGYGGSAAESGFSTEHEISLSGLKRFTSYHFKISAQTEAGGSSASADKTFRTKFGWWIFSLSE